MKIDVFFAVNRYQVDMGMRNFEPENDDGDFFTSYISLYFTRDPFGENHHVRQRPVVQVENIVGLLFRDDQRVTLCKRIDIQKCKISVVLGYLVARDLPFTIRVNTEAIFYGFWFGLNQFHLLFDRFDLTFHRLARFFEFIFAAQFSPDAEIEFDFRLGARRTD